MTLHLGCIGPVNLVDRAGNVRSRYERWDKEFTLSGIQTFLWNLGPDGGMESTPTQMGGKIYPLPDYPDVQLWLDEEPLGPWILGPPWWPTTVDLDALRPGRHNMRIFGRWPTVVRDTLFCDNVPFHTGPPIPIDQPQDMYIGPSKFDRAYGAVRSDRAVKIHYPGFVPTPKFEPLAPRVAEPWTTLLPNSKLWVTRMGVSMGEGLGRRFTIRERRVGCANYQQYHYYDQRRDNVPLVDGGRGVSTMGHAVAGRVNPNGSLYWVAANGRVGWTGLNGQTLTIAGRHLKSGPTGTALAPTPNLQPYAYSTDKATQLEWFCDWKTPGMQQDFRELWDLAFYPDAPAKPTHPLVLFTDTQPVTGDGGSLTGMGRVLMMDHTPVHTGGLPPVWELWKHPAKDAQVWGIAGRNPFVAMPDGRYYVTACMAHELWALDVNVDGTEPNVIPRQTVAERVFESVLKPTLADLGMTERFEQVPRFTAQQLRDKYCKDGPFGVASITFPQSIRFMSDGRALVAERYTKALRLVDFRARTVETFAHHWHDSAYDRDWTLDVNVDGTTGPKDLVLGTLWYPETDLQWTADGVSHGRWVPEGASIADLQVVEGPADKMVGQSYVWFVASGYGRRYTGSTGHHGFSMVTRRQPTDPVLNSTLYVAGRSAYRYGGGDVPSFTLSHGDEFQGQLGLPVADELAQMSDLELAAYFRAGLGTGIPRTYTDAEMAALIYYTRWNAVGNVGPPPPVTRTAPNQITAIVT